MARGVGAALLLLLAALPPAADAVECGAHQRVYDLATFCKNGIFDEDEEV